MGNIHWKTRETQRRRKPDQFEMDVGHLLSARALEIENNDGLVGLARFNIRITGRLSREGVPHYTLSGEVSDFIIDHSHDFAAILEQRYKELFGYDVGDVDVSFTEQSHELNSNKTGDTCTPIAVANGLYFNNLPAEHIISPEICRLIDDTFEVGKVPEEYAKVSGISEIPELRGDGKITVVCEYNGHRLVRVRHVIVAAQHVEGIGEGSEFEAFQQDITHLVRGYLKVAEEKYGFPTGDPKIVVNGAGPWSNGGICADGGNNEAKPHLECMGGYGTGTDSLNSEDDTKTDGTGFFAMRYVSSAITGNIFSEFVTSTGVYVIGQEVVDLNLQTIDKSNDRDRELERLIQRNIPLDVPSISRELGLRDPALYRKLADEPDYLLSPKLPWNQVRELK